MSACVVKRLAVVGASRAAEAYLDAVAQLPELVACALVEPESEREPRPLFRRLRRFRSIDELLRYRAVPDIAVLCTPPGEHRDQGLPLLRAGADLIVHMPLATRPAEAEQLLEAAERSGRELTTSVPHRLSRALLRARDALRNGAVGTLRRVEISLSEKLDAQASWRGDPALSGGGVWMQLGPQALDVLQTCAGPLERIRMLELHERQGAGVDDEVRVETAHRSGLLGCIRLTWNEQRTNPIALCAGDEGELLVGPSQMVIRREQGEEVMGRGHDARAATAEVLQEHLRRRRSLHPPIDTGPETVAWIDAAYRSLRDQRWHRA